MKLTQIKDKMPSKIVIPKEFDQFFEWTQNKENLINGNVISGCFEWCNYSDRLHSWFGKKTYEKFKIGDKLGLFGVGSMGNMYCFWIDDDGHQKIVHLGSDGSDLLVLGNDFITFLQYLAIGYPDPDPIDFTKTAKELEQENFIDYKAVTRQSMIEQLKKSLENFDEIANVFDEETVSGMKKYSENEIAKLEKMDDAQFNAIFKEGTKDQNVSSVNCKLQDWIKNTFKVNIPITASKIVNLNDKSFENWVNTMPYDD